jgi:phosphoribosylaminoimidazole-succinocarboxamide synthase
MVASDRISAFDVILPETVPEKGRILTGLSSYWFRRTAEIVPNHLLSTDLDDLPPPAQRYRDALDGRFMIVRKAERIDVECVVRGYLAGSAWLEYQQFGTVCGERLRPEMVESEKLDRPIFTPATKADAGHDENVSVAHVQSLLGPELTEQLAEVSIRLYLAGASHAADCGLIVADSKFEFGIIDGEVTLIDELLTPDSSRFWDASTYQAGRAQASFDKQPVRDWLTATGWNRLPPPPNLPNEIVDQTAARYREAFRRLTGEDLSST